MMSRLSIKKMSNIKCFVLDSVDTYFITSQKLERSDILILSPTLLLSRDLSKVFNGRNGLEYQCQLGKVSNLLC